MNKTYSKVQSNVSLNLINSLCEIKCLTYIEKVNKLLNWTTVKLNSLYINQFKNK